MKKYEYRIIDHDFFDEHELEIMDIMGNSGWDIIKILKPMKYVNSEGLFIRIYYKRKIDIR